METKDKCSENEATDVHRVIKKYKVPTGGLGEPKQVPAAKETVLLRVKRPRDAEPLEEMQLEFD